jgi:pyruvate/2-oxoglutarate dehydrogenase complex dihydrolipoamide acyltransferase (E2) component
LDEVKGSGRDGRVLKEDVLKYLEDKSGKSQQRSSSKQSKLKIKLQNLIYF